MGVAVSRGARDYRCLEPEPYEEPPEEPPDEPPEPDEDEVVEVVEVVVPAFRQTVTTWFQPAQAL